MSVSSQSVVSQSPELEPEAANPLEGQLEGGAAAATDPSAAESGAAADAAAPGSQQALVPYSHALEITGLTKSFAGFRAVDELSLQIKRGEFYALLGPNGAGKTTTLRMVAGLLQPDAGEVSICGVDARKEPVEAKRVVAWVSDEPMICDKLTPFEYLEFIAGLWDMDPDVAQFRADALLEQFGLDAHSGERCQGFSKGMRQKVALAGALIHDPQLIILVEPLTGLDAGSARQVKAVLRGLVARGVTVIMTTHILEVAERMADRIGVIARGRLIAEGTLAELRANAGNVEQSLEDIFLDIVSETGGAAEPGETVEAAA